GVDAAQPKETTDYKRYGETSKQEGRYSGFVQPLEHVLAKYVSRVPKLATSDKEIAKQQKDIEAGKQELRAAGFKGKQTGSDLRYEHIYGMNFPSPEKSKEASELINKLESEEGRLSKLEKEKEKLTGAEKLLKALEETGKARIMTDYTKVKDTPVMKEWEKTGGTFWGFEDIRGTYVDCARANPDKKGERQLRMMDIWMAISGATTKEGYEKLLRDPEKTVEEFVVAGEKAAKEKEEYKDRDEKFWTDFREKGKSFLLRLAKQTPIDDLELAKKRGLEPDKFMNAKACKEGLHWANEGEK